MDILQINKQTLYNLYEQFPESFKGLSLEGNDLIYKNERIDISNFNINDLLTSEISFSSSLSVLAPEDIFKIIRLHALKINSDIKNNSQSETKKKVEIIKSENPLMKNISIVTRTRNQITEEFINIVDSNGKDHLFKNDRNIDLFAIYEALKLQSGNTVTPDELIAAINRKLHEIQLEDSRDLNSRSTTREDFINKINTVSTPYKDDLKHKVYGSEDYDIAVVADELSNDHRIVTFDQNQHGDLVVENHSQNVAGSDTTLVTDSQSQNIDFDQTVSNTTSVEVKASQEKEVTARLLTHDEFAALINSPSNLSETERRDVDLYYAYIGDLIIYEDYLLPELQNMLNQFRSLVYEMEYSDSEKELNEKQQELIDKNKELEEKKAQNFNSETIEQINNEVKRLQLVKESNGTSTGAISTLQVIALIVGISIILTAITLYLID